MLRALSAALLCAASVRETAAQVTARQVVNIDLGWRFFLGNPTSSGCAPNVTFPLNYTGIQCSGLSNAPSGVDPASCQAACCDSPSCSLWQWCEPGKPCGPAGSCWIGSSTECQSGEGWISYGRNSSTPVNPAPASPSYDDSAWEVVDAPYDVLINGTFNSTESQGQAFLPKNVSWFRKHFVAPASWAGSTVELQVEGAFAISYWFLNGNYLGTHQYGYTTVLLRLDNASLVFGQENVLAVFLDGTAAACTGWWYEGSGIYRHNYLVVTNPVRLATHGVFAPSYLLGNYHPRSTPAEGLTVDTAMVLPSAEVQNNGMTSASASVTFTLVAADGVTVVGSQSASGTVNASSTVKLVANQISVSNAELWSVPRPYLHTLVTTLTVNKVVVDSTNTSVGLRSIRWDPELGAFINEQPTKMRGYCNHNTFTGVGTGVPDRINLFRIQAVRGTGGNAWRTSHNPPIPALLDIADRLGIMMLDENRIYDFGDEYIDNMVDLVRRDRNHPSVIFWSGCNEVGCGGQAGGNYGTYPTLDFKTVTDENDGSRAFTGNMCVDWGSCPKKEQYPFNNMSILLDVQGFSHNDDSMFTYYHALNPDKPLAATECCSCEGQRAEDADLPHNSSEVFYTDNTAPCLSQQTQWCQGLPFCAGSFVWTAFDYFGEPDHWPHISSSFGTYDLCGFPKPAVWWFRSWWLANVSESDAARPPVPGTSTFVRVVETWQPPAQGSTRTIHVYSNAAQVQLQVNGAVVATKAMSPFGVLEFDNVAYTQGTVTAVAMDESGNQLATHASKSWGAAASIVLSIDAPSPTTGTGAALYLDGEDVALVRATVVDAAGAVVQDSSLPITFSVTNGPGIIVGTGSGNPSDHDYVLLPTRVTYHALARAVVRVALDASGTDADRAVRAQVNMEAGKGPRSSGYLPTGGTPPTSLTVTATSPGLPPATITLPLSVNPADSVLAVAAASVASAYIGE